jgi:hypothetical protein
MKEGKAEFRHLSKLTYNDTVIIGEEFTVKKIHKI